MVLLGTNPTGYFHELLRLYSFPYMTWATMQPTTINYGEPEQKTINYPSGTELYFLPRSAMRDENVFPNGDEFIMDRDNIMRMLTFGGPLDAVINKDTESAPRFCLGYDYAMQFLPYLVMKYATFEAPCFDDNEKS
eukprot:UN27868